jgi:acetyltransferase-like isoleucine patch superfamily enzyme
MTLGKNCKIHHYTWIGDEVEIGDDCKIQAFAYIPNGVKIEDNVFIGPHVCFTNDKYPGIEWGEYKETVVEDGASIGANATILPGVRIGAGALIGAGAIVTKDVEDYKIWKSHIQETISDRTR